MDAYIKKWNDTDGFGAHFQTLLAPKKKKSEAPKAKNERRGETRATAEFERKTAGRFGFP